MAFCIDMHAGCAERSGTNKEHGGTNRRKPLRARLTGRQAQFVREIAYTLSTRIYQGRRNRKSGNRVSTPAQDLLARSAWKARQRLTGQSTRRARRGFPAGVHGVPADSDYAER
jgi:hypothetical protein